MFQPTIDIYIGPNESNSPTTWKNVMDQLESEIRSTDNLASNTYSLPKSGLVGPGLRDRPDPRHYIDREDIWKLMDNHFREERVCVLQGVGGSGKTFAATKYAFRRVN